MTKKISYLAILVVSLVAISQFGGSAKAAAPTLLLTSTGDGDSVQIDVTGDAGKSVVLSYYKTGYVQQLSFIGNTNASGSFSTVLSTIAYGISQNSTVHVVVNGQQSAEVAWPYASVGSLLGLNQTGLVIPLGQTASLTAYNNGTNLLFLASNSNPSIANVNIAGSQINITANGFGSTMVTVCSQASTATCASAYVTVQNTGAKPIVFSQANLILASSQNLPVSIYGGTGVYTILNNSNAGAVQAVISGSTINLSTSNSSGYSAISVCSSDMSSCGVINVTLGTANTSGFTLSQSNPILAIGQSLSLNISGGPGGNYSILSNSSPSIVDAYIANNSLSLSGKTGGVSTVVVCSSMAACSSVSVSVNYSATSGPIALSQNNLWLAVGQTVAISISGGKTPYSLFNGSSGLLQAAITDNALSVTGSGVGSGTVDVCSAAGACVTLSVLVNGTNQTVPLTLSQNSAAMYAGNSLTIPLTGNGGYYVSSNSNQSISSATISGSGVAIKALAAGSTNVLICQNGGQCANLAVSVKEVPQAAIISVPVTPVATPAATVAPTKPTTTVIPVGVKKFKFTKQLFYGANNNDVKELQKCLTAEGMFNYNATGRYLSMTVAAVKKYQKKHNIRQTGNVGPLTLAALNK